MHIALVISSLRGKAGVSTHLRDLAKLLPRQGVSVSILSTDVECQGPADGLRFVRIPSVRRRLRILFTSLELARLHRRDRIDIVHCFDSVEFLGIYPFASLSRVPTVFTVVASIFSPGREIDYSLARTQLLKFTNTFVAHHADRLICCSQEMVRCMRYAGAAESKMTVLYYPVDSTLFYPREAPQSRANTRHGLNCLLVGLLRPTKGAEYLIRAVPAVLARFPRVTFTIVGEGPLKDDLVALSLELGVGHAVSFKGYVEYEHLGHYYRNADVLVIPSLNEPLALVLLQALASGLPIIGTRVGGIPEVVTDGLNGKLVEPSCPSALAGALIQALGDEQFLKDASANALATAKQHCSEANVDQLIEIYRGLLKQGS